MSTMKNQIKILFNLVATQPDVFSKFHGGGKYGEIILRRIIERGLPVSCYFDSKKWLNPIIKELVVNSGIELYDISTFSIEQILEKSLANRLYSPQFSKQLVTLNCVEIFGTIHGLRGLETPWDYDMINYKPNKNLLRYIYYSIFKAKRVRREYDYIRSIFNNPNIHVVTVSNHSASSIKSYFPELSKLSIPVFYSPSTSVSVVQDNKYMDNYFLLVSANRSYKNALRAIKAFDRLFDAGFLEGYTVRITGASSWNAYRYIPHHKERFIFHGFVDDQELEQLYHDAYCLVYPSLNEGFGYPPLEAMHYGIPIISSSFSSIPEVCGDAVMYFNPLSIEEIMSRIILISDKERHNDYSLRSKERYRKISFLQERDLNALVDYIYK